MEFSGKGTFTEIHTMFEYANQKGLIGLGIPPIHRDLHVVDVGQRHFQLPVEEARARTQNSFNTDRKHKSYWPSTGVLSHIPSCRLRH